MIYLSGFSSPPSRRSPWVQHRPNTAAASEEQRRIGRRSWPGACRRRERGVVLILAVFAIALLLALAIGLTTAVRAELLASRASFERLQSLFLAQAGVNEARAILLYEDPTVDTLQDDWGPEAEQPLDLPAELPGGYVRVRVYDACGRIDINTAPFSVLAKLTGDAALAQSIIDWRQRGTEEDYYRSLAFPYLPRKGAFESPAELLLVKGVTPDLYYGTAERPGLADLVTVASPSLDTNAAGKVRTQIATLYTIFGMNENQQQLDAWLSAMLGGGLSEYEVNDIASKLQSSFNQYHRQGGVSSLADFARLANLSDQEIIAIVDNITARHAHPGDNNCATGRVNVNTASHDVLAMLPGSSDGLADALIAQRERQPFKSMSEVATAVFGEGGGRAAFDQGLLDELTTKSSAFIIQSMGYTAVGHGYCTLDALVFRDVFHQIIPIVRQAEEDAPLPPPLQAAGAVDTGQQGGVF